MTSLVCVGDFEKHAFSVLPRNALDYYRSGAGREETLKENRRAFAKYVGLTTNLSGQSLLSME